MTIPERTDPPARRDASIVGVGGAMVLLLCGGLYLAGPLRENPGWFLAIHTGLFAVMLLAVRLLNARPARAVMAGIVAVAFLARLIPVGVEVSLSDDVYRYIWDGRLTLAGENPFEYVPSSPEMEEYRAQWPDLFAELNSPDYYSVYPPLSQWFFAGGVWIGNVLSPDGLVTAAIVLRGIFGFIDGLTVLALLLLMGRLGIAGKWVLLYAWNPLPIVEFGAAGHSDSPMMLALVLGVYGLSRAGGALGGVALGLAAASKLLPAVFLPFWLLRGGWRVLAGFLAAMVATGALFWSPAMPGNILASVRLYYELFQFNAGPYEIVLQLYKAAGVDYAARWAGWTTGAVFGVAWLVLVGFAMAGRFRPDEPMMQIRITVALLGLYLLLSSTIHPWYITWVLAFMPILPMFSWMFLGYAISFSYLFYAGIDGRIFNLYLAGMWCVFFGLLAVDLRSWWLPRLMRRSARRKYNAIRPRLAGKSVLDIGAAEGWIDEWLQRDGLDVHLLDVIDLNRTGLPLRVYDGTTIPFEGRQFDTTMILLTLHHCGDPDQVLEEAIRVTRHRLIVSESVYRYRQGHWVLWFLDTVVNCVRSDSSMAEALHFRTVEEWRDCFARHGLEVKEEHWLSRGVHRHVMFVLEREGGEESG